MANSAPAALRSASSRGPQANSLDGQSLERRRLRLDPDLPLGYHRLTVEPGGGATTLVVTPGRCWLPETLARGRRLVGLAAQIYLLRSADNWGIGDFTDLRRLVELAASRGAAVIGVNPLHAMFFDNPEQASPYSPASRLLLNVLNIDVMAVPEARNCPDVSELIASDEFQERIDACRSEHLVDYRAVTELKLSILEQIFDACRSPADRPLWREFEQFRREQGETLERNCLFLALREHFARQDPALADWHGWPEEYREPASPAVMRFKEAKPGSSRFSGMAAMGRRPAAWRRRRRRQEARHGGGSLSRPRRRRGPCRSRDLGELLPPWYRAPRLARLRTFTIRRDKTGVCRRFIPALCASRDTAALSS